MLLRQPPQPNETTVNGEIHQRTATDAAGTEEWRGSSLRGMRSESPTTRRSERAPPHLHNGCIIYRKTYTKFRGKLLFSTHQSSLSAPPRTPFSIYARSMPQ